MESEYKGFTCYPPRENIMNAFSFCGPKDIRVVIIAQDPYASVGQANGLAFSAKDLIAYPPSLINIFKELEADIGSQPKSGDLTPWAEQGVLLLNSILTVRAHSPGSHQTLGWETGTNEIIEKLSSINPNIVYLLWGNYARLKKPLIKRSLGILEASHPSPLAAKGFFGCKHFSKTNDLLKNSGLSPINWIAGSKIES